MNAMATVGLTFPPKRRKPFIDRVQRETFENKNNAYIQIQALFLFEGELGSVLPEG